jgi:hypothetical protein
VVVGEVLDAMLCDALGKDFDDIVDDECGYWWG